MNFGKNSTQKKRKQLSSASSKRGKRAGVTFLRILFLSFAAVCVIFCCMGIGAFRAILDTAPDISDVNIMPSGNATFVYDADGNQLQKLSAPNANRMSVSISKIPLNMQHAIVAIEDERFYEHAGYGKYKSQIRNKIMHEVMEDMYEERKLLSGVKKINTIIHPSKKTVTLYLMRKIKNILSENESVI